MVSVADAIIILIFDFDDACRGGCRPDCYQCCFFMAVLCHFVRMLISSCFDVGFIKGLRTCHTASSILMISVYGKGISCHCPRDTR